MSWRCVEACGAIRTSAAQDGCRVVLRLLMSFRLARRPTVVGTGKVPPSPAKLRPLVFCQRPDSSAASCFTLKTSSSTSLIMALRGETAM